MRRITAILGLAFALVLTSGASAQAITGDVSDDFDHPYVGLIAFYDANGAFVHRCSGSLLTDTVFLTAGHCVTLDEKGTLAASARIWFEQDAGADYDPATGAPARSGYPVTGGVTAGTLHNYGFLGPTLPETHDVGLAILDQPVTTVYPDLTRYGSLAHAGTLEEYTASHPGDTATVTLSGYGVTSTTGNPAEDVSYRSRLQADTFILGLDTPQTGEVNVELAANPGGDGGGACFGDSGGPMLLPETDVISAVTSLGNATCSGASYSYRTDQDAVIAWILKFAESEADEITIV
jgi:hypothetical protein